MTSSKRLPAALLLGALLAAAFIGVALFAHWRVTVAVVAGGVGISLALLLLALDQVRRLRVETAQQSERLGELKHLAHLEGIRKDLRRIEGDLPEGAVTALSAKLDILEAELPERIAVRSAADLARLRHSLESG